jgi:aminoglycoside phosphotransferase (APT) family kinase protein
MLPDDADARIATRLGSELGHPVSVVEVTRLAGGHSSGAWRLDVTTDRPLGPYVLKAPEVPSVVYQRDAVREARILDDLGRAGAPVPAIVAIDASGDVVGRSSFVMELVEGRTVEDAGPGGFHATEWLRSMSPTEQRAVWDGFHDAMAALHTVEAAKVPDASLGPNGSLDVIEHWRASLLDAAPAENVPRQLAALDWLAANLPPGADVEPAVCMGDARIVNALIAGTDTVALIDFEVAYAGNPAADVGYSLFISASQHATADPPLPGIPTPDETWARWSRATGRSIEHRDYWTAFGAMVLAITATRAMVQWGIAGPSVDTDNPLVAAWEATVEQAARR